MASFRQVLVADADDGEDERLIEGVKARDLSAFEEMYRAHYRRLSRFLLNLTHRPTIVEEVLNDTMMAVWQKPDSFRGTSRLSTWILAIAYNKAMSALRRQDVPIDYVEAAGEADPDEMPDRSSGRARTRRLLHEAMARLPTDHRVVLDLTYFHELGYREIAEIMKCPVDTVKTRMFHARRNLKRLLAGSPADWL